MITYTEATPILGPLDTSVDESADYIVRHTRGEYTDHDIRGVIVPRYLALSIAVGLRPRAVIAMLCIESDELSSALSQRKDKDGRDLRNPAGIGVYESKSKATPHFRSGCVWDADVKGYRPACQFKTWVDDAIPAHVGRVLAYATHPTVRTPIQRALVQKAMSYRILPIECHGSAPILLLFGKGPNTVPNCGWAGGSEHEGADYGAHIARVANAIAGLK